MKLAVSHKLDITSNMEELAEKLQEDILKKYGVIVTEDKLQDSKDLMAQVNKDKKEFIDKWKAFKEKILEPFLPLNEKAKKIEGYYDKARLALSNQVDNFEKGKREAIKVIVARYRDDACLKANITPESITINDLVILSAVSTNSKGYSITKKTSDAIDQRIQAVENQILKAKLEAEEKAKRDHEIAENARREAEDRARVREAELLARAEREKVEALQKAEREKAEAVKDARVEAIANNNDDFRVSEERANYLLENAKQVQKPTFTDNGKRIFTITATFEVSAPKQTPTEKIINKLQSMIEGAGITSLKNIEVR